VEHEQGEHLALLFFCRFCASNLTQNAPNRQTVPRLCVSTDSACDNLARRRENLAQGQSEIGQDVMFSDLEKVTTLRT